MSNKIRDTRIVYMSVYDFLTSSFINHNYVIISGHNLPYITSGLYALNGSLVDTGNAVVPSFVLETKTIMDDAFQLGPGLKDTWHYNIDVYARSDGERDDIGELLRHFLRPSIPIYDYNVIISGGNYITLAHGEPKNIVAIFDRFDPKIRVLRHTMRVYFDLDVFINSGNTLVT